MATPSPAPATPSCSGDAFSCSDDVCSFSGVKVNGGGEIEMGERNPKGVVYEMEMRKAGDDDEMVSVYQKP